MTRDEIARELQRVELETSYLKARVWECGGGEVDGEDLEELLHLAQELRLRAGWFEERLRDAGFINSL